MAGSAHYRRGTQGEYLVKTHLELHGWYVVRAYASKGPWDLLALKREHRPLMVQVKATTSKHGYMRPSERAELLSLCHAAGARAVLAHVPHPSSSTFDGLSYVELTSMADRVELEP